MSILFKGLCQGDCKGLSQVILVTPVAAVPVRDRTSHAVQRLEKESHRGAWQEGQGGRETGTEREICRSCFWDSVRSSIHVNCVSCLCDPKPVYVIHMNYIILCYVQAMWRWLSWCSTCDPSIPSNPLIRQTT
jgi:hypothetical protein